MSKISNIFSIVAIVLSIVSIILNFVIKGPKGDPGSPGKNGADPAQDLSDSVERLSEIVDENSNLINENYTTLNQKIDSNSETLKNADNKYVWANSDKGYKIMTSNLKRDNNPNTKYYKPQYTITTSFSDNLTDKSSDSLQVSQNIYNEPLKFNFILE